MIGSTTAFGFCRRVAPWVSAPVEGARVCLLVRYAFRLNDSRFDHGWADSLTSALGLTSRWRPFDSTSSFVFSRNDDTFETCLPAASSALDSSLISTGPLTFRSW